MRLRREGEQRRRSASQANWISTLSRVQILWRKRQARLRVHETNIDADRKRRERPSTKYDAVICLRSLSEFVSTGSIDVLQPMESLFDMAKVAQYRIIAVVGLYDKGKTWLVNKLFGINLPSGKLFSTTGLSFAWIPERRILVLDTAGMQ